MHRITGRGIYKSEGCEFVYTVTSQALGYPTCRLSLVVPESRGVWTEASAHALHRPSVAVQVFQVECGYMRSLKIIGKSQSWRYHGNNLPGMHKLKAWWIEGRVTSVVRKKSSSVEDLSQVRVGETIDRSRYTNWQNIHALQVLYMRNGSQGLNKRNRHRMRKACGYSSRKEMRWNTYMRGKSHSNISANG